MRHAFETVILGLAMVSVFILITLCIFGFGGVIVYLAWCFGHTIFACVLASILLMLYTTYIVSLCDSIHEMN